jgi:hypothetical protein
MSAMSRVKRIKKSKTSMDEYELERQAEIAVHEAIAWYTLAIDVSLANKDNPDKTKPDWGTGSLLRIQERSFVATCKHVVRPEYKNEDLRFIYRTEQAFHRVDKDHIKKVSLYSIFSQTDKSYPRKIPIINKLYSDDKDDLVLLEVDPPYEEIESYNFFEIKNMEAKTPEANTPVYFTGYSRDLTRTVTKHGDISVFPYFEVAQIVEKKVESFDYDPKRHFLIEYENIADRVNPHGLSGCGVWSRKPSGPNKLWTPNVYLVGIQHGYFKNSQVLTATRVERMLKIAGVT